eukprot:scpid88273/ scgid17380/ 
MITITKSAWTLAITVHAKTVESSSVFDDFPAGLLQLIVFEEVQLTFLVTSNFVVFTWALCTSDLGVCCTIQKLSSCKREDRQLFSHTCAWMRSESESSIFSIQLN